MGVEATFAISAEHGSGIETMLERLVEDFPEAEEEAEEPGGIRIAVIGKPNAGKSLLINKLLKFDRCIVSEIPGTTRDAVDSSVVLDGTEFILVDTAGIRRKGKTTRLLEKISVIMALKALERCDIAVSMSMNSVPSSTMDESTASRVVPGISETIQRSDFNNLLISDDLPALGFPITAMRMPPGSSASSSNSGKSSTNRSSMVSIPEPCSAEIAKVASTPI